MKLGKQILKRIEKEKRQERKEIEHAAQELWELEKKIGRKFSELFSELYGRHNEKIRKRSG